MALPPEAGQGAEPLLIDRIDALRVLRADTDAEKGRLLEEIAGHGRVEQDIVSQLSKVRPLWRPDVFEQAHRFAMRSLEVLDRNGARSAAVPRMGPLKAVARPLVQLATRWIVRGHENSLASNIRKLYERREANSEWGSAEHHMLRRARIDVTRVEQGLRSNPLGLPAFLLGGAFLTGLLSGLWNLILSALDSRLGVVLFAVAALALFLSLAWVALFSAAVARRRIHLSTDQPIASLYEVIGAAGDPPKDQSLVFAVVAIALLGLAGIIIPLAVLLILQAN